MAAEGRAGRVEAMVAQARRDRDRLNAGALGPFSLTTLGVASVVGSGIFVSVGTAAAQDAGPAVVISLVLAGVAAGLTAVCYAELASIIPAAGSTYSYAYAIFGLFLGWFIGWDLLLEYLFAASTVASGWAGYATDLLGSAGLHVPQELAAAPLGPGGGVVNLPAMIVVLLVTGLLVIGIRESARTNNAMVALKIVALLLVIAFGAAYVSTANWSPFVPHSDHFGDFGAGGILRGAGVVFFAYVGFDAVSTAAAEARNPRRTVPIGLIATVIVSTLLYVGIALVMTGLVSYRELGVSDPISAALSRHAQLHWLRTLVDFAAVVGLASTVLVTFYGQTRILMRMSSDGMLPPVFGRVSERFRTPESATMVCGAAGAVIAGLVPVEVLTNLVSIGTLLSFVIVSSGVVVLRRTRPDLERPFRVPYVGVVAGVAVLSALALMLTLPPDTWIRLVVWLLIGLTIFFLYARRRATAKLAELRA